MKNSEKAATGKEHGMAERSSNEGNTNYRGHGLEAGKNTAKIGLDMYLRSLFESFSLLSPFSPSQPLTITYIAQDLDTRSTLALCIPWPFASDLE